MQFVIMGMLAAILAQANTQRPVLAHQMSCAEAQSFYHQHKRIYVLAHGRTVVPLYGFKSMEQYKNLYCEPRKAIQPVWVKTRDDARCMIGAYCQG